MLPTQIPIDASEPGSFEPVRAVSHAVAEMVANGAHFTITRRDDGKPSFLWETSGAGNRSACRRIIAEAKQNSATYWRAFLDAIVEHAGGPAR